MITNRTLAFIAISAAAFGAPFSAAAQGSWVLRGRIVDGETGDPLDGAIVAAIGGAALASVGSDARGWFVLRVDTAARRLVAARIGFRPETLAVESTSRPVTIQLRAAPPALEPVLIAAERTYAAASSSIISALDIALRPRESSQDLLRLAPGLVIAQHAGGGKAEQIFLRGVDADHGTDVALSVDGVPVNLVSHAHGQGYADLHFLIPEVVEGADVRKGPLDVRDGDFATAGSVTLRTRDRIASGAVSLRGGSFGTLRALALLPLGGAAPRGGGYAAIARHVSRGPFQAPQGHERTNGYLKWSAPIGQSAELSASASTYGARWSASGQIPERAVTDGRIGRFGSIDASEGGVTERHDASLALSSLGAEGSGWSARLYGTRYRLGLFSNFTFFLDDTANGDGVEQRDDRWIVGGQVGYERLAPMFGRDGRWSAAAGVRADRATVALHRQVGRRRIETRSDARVEQENVFAWWRRELIAAERLRVQVGLRGDLMRLETRERSSRAVDLDDVTDRRWAAILSPKAALAFDLMPSLTLFAGAGTGFHSNDARAAAEARRRADVLPRASGAELGSRKSWSGGSVGVAVWLLDLESELVYSGDEGTTEPAGRTRRTGVDVDARTRLLPWLWADADLTVARGRFRDAPAGADRIPLAPALTATAGLTVRDVGPVGGGLRVRHVAARPATEDASIRARGQAVWELFTTWRSRSVELTLAIDNLFDVEWNEAQFATTSRLRGEPSPSTELHFTPGAPRALHVGATYRF